MSQKTTIQIPDYHPDQQTIRKSLDRFNVLCCGRRYGKDIFGQNYTVERLLRGRAFGWYLPSYKDLLENWRYFVNVLYPITERKKEEERRLDLVTGGTLEMWSLEDKDASRGRQYDDIVINECGLIPHLEYSWNAAIRPTLAVTQGGGLFMGTPKGLTYFHTLYQRGLAGERGWKSFKRTSYDNPIVPKSELDEIRATTPDLYFRQEYLAEFVTMEGAVFRRIQEAVYGEPISEPEPKHEYIAGVDVAAAVDYTVVSVMDAATKRMVYMDRFSRVDYGVLEDRIHAVYQRFGCRLARVESNSIGQPVIDALIRRGMNIQGFVTTGASKQLIITALQSAFEHGEIGIPNYPVLIGELLSFESKRTASGNFTYSAPEGAHDDCVMSLAIAWDAINAPALFVSGRY